MDGTLQLALTYAVSAAIGLLVGTERERKPSAKAGLRTFALIALLGTACAMLGQQLGSAWMVPVGFAVIGLVLAGAQLTDPRSVAEDAGTTTVTAALLVFLLGAMNFHGERTLAVALGIGLTALLYFKTELEGVAVRLTSTDIRSMLQFGAVSAVVLPLLPNRGFGPYEVLNPFHIWLMVVLISGVSLAGYVAWRLTLERKGLLLAGLLGGVISSTATTFSYARGARDGQHSRSGAIVVLLLANAAMLVRVLLLVSIAAPVLLVNATIALLPALLLTLPVLAWHFRLAGSEQDNSRSTPRNPTQIVTALLFACLYALILLAASWLSDRVGSGGLFALSFISGLTDVDAITLSSSRLAVQEAIGLADASMAVAIAVGSNILFKSIVALTVGGRALGPAVIVAFALPLAGLVAGLLAMRALA